MVSHPTRDKLIDAALALGDHRPLSQISIDDIVRQAGVAKGTFYVHFADRGAFLDATSNRFHQSMFRVMADAVGDLPPGADRLRAGALAYLDACHAQLGVKSILIEARAEPAVAVGAARRNTEMSAAAAPVFAVLGAADPEIAARLFVALVAEAVLMEVERGGIDDRARAALIEFIPTPAAARRVGPRPSR
jgi:AcrR family transcriptional regulator